MVQGSHKKLKAKDVKKPVARRNAKKTFKGGGKATSSTRNNSLAKMKKMRKTLAGCYTSALEGAIAGRMPQAERDKFVGIKPDAKPTFEPQRQRQEHKKQRKQAKKTKAAEVMKDREMADAAGGL
eukprot:Hpha_TRINITY_DN15015_c0_g1::TRINITY_DN15015_c0_g1_i1::g.123506::m.123506